MKLHCHDIIGKKLTCILQTSQVLDGWIHFASHYFVLDSGIAFSFPVELDSGFVSAQIPENAEEITHSRLNKAIGSKITNVYRPEQDKYFGPDEIIIHLDSGLWLWQESSAPEDVQHCVGVYIEPIKPDGDFKMTEYWNLNEE